MLKELADALQVFCLIVASDSNYDHVWVVSSVRPSNPPMFIEFPDIGRRAPTHSVAPGIALLGGARRARPQPRLAGQHRE